MLYCGRGEAVALRVQRVVREVISVRVCGVRGGAVEGRMLKLKHLRLAGGIVVLVAGSPLIAQQRAPQNESIKQDDLRADLFFLAGDAMRGRLTDTEENRATADYLRSRFERMGLKPAGPNGSYFQPYNLMTATLGDG